MKVAVCISGQCVSNNQNTSILKNNNRLKEHFPECDFYYATWDSFKEIFQQNFPNQNCCFFHEPTINYHPYDIPKKYWESNRYASTRDFILAGGNKFWDWSKNHTKQLLIHAWLCKHFLHQYDVIVRTRFDVWISNNADFKTFLIDTYENNRINAITATKKRSFHKLKAFATNIGEAHHEWLVDQIIIHPASFLNPAYVDYLNESKRLHPAEMGWYQILSKPNNSSHHSYDGWANHDKNIMTKDFYNGYGDAFFQRPSALPHMLIESLQAIYADLRRSF
jgi:hypothetical protein